jgi:hypothetical protein
MFDITIITGLASLMGCLCMALVCAAQIAELFAAARPAAAQPWDLDFTPAPTRQVFAAFEPGLTAACA